eukprot:7904040-Pyramimonas_sp.AAC.1
MSDMMQQAPDTMRGGLEVCFFGDGAIAVIGAALHLLEAAPKVAAVVAASSVRRGIRLNFAAGKTE